MKILFIGARLFDDVAFYLKEKGIKSILTESNNSSPNLNLADEVFIVPRGMKKPMEIAIENDVDGVIPLIGIDDPLLEVAKMKEELESNHNIPVISSSIQAIELSSNKFKTKEFFIKNKILTPEFIVTDNYLDILNKIQDNDSNFNLPIVLKQASGQGGKNIQIGNNISQIKDYFSEFGTALCERFIEGLEISIEVLSYKNKDKKYHFPLIPVYKGKTNLEGNHPLNNIRSAPCDIEGLDNEDVKNLAIKIAEKLDCEGTIDIDFIFSIEEKKLYAIEINTRPSGTRYLTGAGTGINPLIKLVDMVTNEFDIDSIENEICDYFALEIPVGNYKGPLKKPPLKKFTKNSWIVHGPPNHERLTISGQTKEKVCELYPQLISEKSEN